MKIFLSNFVSALLVPLLIPVYLFGIMLFLFPDLTTITMLNEKIRLMIEVASFTAFLPLLSVFLLYKFKVISSLSLIKREDRLLPQLISVFLFGIFSYLMISTYGFNNTLTLVQFANTLSLIILIFITQHFKISAHTSGAAGLIVITSFLLMKPHSISYSIIYSIFLLLSIGVFFARLILKAHTRKQVIYGGILGVLSSAWLVFFI